MSLESFFSALSHDLPVVFAYIGWSRDYDGTEQLIGTHRELVSNPTEMMEVLAFARGHDGYFRCGIGRGGVNDERFHVVFVALEPESQTKEMVGLYADALAEIDGLYTFAITQNAALIPSERRPVLTTWAGQGMRRWARRDSGRSHPALLGEFERLRADLPRLLAPLPDLIDADQTYSGLEAREGLIRETLVQQRSREAKLRTAKLHAALAANGGRLVCEVPECGFDFFERYGKIGEGFAHVHHRQSLSLSGEDGRTNTLDDLAIVCANCHAMIHRGGECRDMRTLISRQDQE